MTINCKIKQFINSGARFIVCRAAVAKRSSVKTPDGWLYPAEANKGNHPISAEIKTEAAGKPFLLYGDHFPSQSLRLAATASGSTAKKNVAEGEADRAIDKASTRLLANAATLI
jgi:hypothetical protein